MKIFFPEPGELELFVEDQIGPYLAAHVAYYQRLRKFLKESHGTDDADEATYLFLPINLILFQFCNVHGVNFAGALPDPEPSVERYANDHPGKRLLLFASGDFGQRRRSAWESTAPNRAYPDVYSWLDERIVLIAFESTNDLLASDIPAIPYVLERSNPPGSLRKRLLGRKSRVPQRDLLYAFAGAMAYPELPDEHIRGGRLLKIAGEGPDWLVASASDAIRLYGKSGGSDLGMLRRARFTLCPAGYGRWSFRLFQAIVYGSIPVLLADGYVLPFADRLNWEDLVIVIPERELEHVDSLLRSLSQSEIGRFLAGGAQYRHHFMEHGAHRLIEERLARVD